MELKYYNLTVILIKAERWYKTNGQWLSWGFWRNTGTKHNNTPINSSKDIRYNKNKKIVVVIQKDNKRLTYKLVTVYPNKGGNLK